MIVFMALIFATLACSTDDLTGVGQRAIPPTATFAVFATATPGGRVSVILNSNPASGSTPVSVSGGNVIGPAATATAAALARSVATLTAAAPPSIPVFQPDRCPSAAVPPAPRRPALFSQFPQAVALFLSTGGAPTTLESTLRSWGAIVDGRGVVQADTDLTGDGILEIIVTIYDPSLFRTGQPSPGQLLIFGCDQRAYKLLYSTPYSGQTILPELRRVGNMNGDGRAQVVYTQSFCNAGICTQAMQILNWNSLIGAFQPLNEPLIDATNSRITIGDPDGDGVLEVTLTSNPPVESAPYRRTVRYWDWNGTHYILATIQLDAPYFRVHAIHDADALFRSGDFRGAIRAYDRIAADAGYSSWWGNDVVVLKSYSGYRKILAYAALRQPKGMDDTLAALQTEHPSGSPGEGWVSVAAEFVNGYKATRSSAKRACVTTLSYLGARTDIVGLINGYGGENYRYTLGELCPF
jgi:hypothetical protein